MIILLRHGNGETKKSRSEPMKLLRVVLFIVSIGLASNLVAQTVCITKTGEKYHTESCRYLKYSKKEITLENAINLGYEACLVCKPGAKVTLKAKSQLTETKKTTQSTPPQRKVTASQCTGTTKSGSRCKRRTKNASGRCYQH